MAACRFEVHHRIPRCLLGFFDRFATADLDGEGLQAWFEWEEEAFRSGVDPDVSREELELLIETSASLVPATAHRSGHSQGGDFARWGRRGGLRPLALYGRGWFALLAGRRWGKITAEQLAESFAPVQGAVLMAVPLFPLGQLVTTPGALALLADAHTNPAELLARHQGGDWGEVPPEDVRENELSVLRGFRILSSYQVGEEGERVWIITEADRSTTCILLPEEY